jgi:hypothetical protein
MIYSSLPSQTRQNNGKIFDMLLEKASHLNSSCIRLRFDVNVKYLLEHLQQTQH